ncbi:S-protein homolog 74-like [Mercurialis annua]|uniref:S-protein homolog 74-like n=1 Tax=Mercurialis annua TaxID=3986 RepID=UPI00215E2633|nr:S-protein homolog 74-like [Mercurialis annua]
MKKFKCLIIFLLALATRRIEAREFRNKVVMFQRYHVYIMNGFKNESIRTHCRSSDTDLGIQKLNPMQKQEWNFRMNFWGTTLFHCTLSWKEGHKRFKAFLPQLYKFIWAHCFDYKYCFWKATEEGVFLMNPDANSYELKFTWKKCQNENTTILDSLYE